MKTGEAALFAVAIFAVVVFAAYLVARVLQQNPQRDAALKAKREEADRLLRLVDGLYRYTREARDTDAVADYVAGEIDRFRRAEERKA